MKNIFVKISAAAALVFGLTACDMNLRPYSVIDPDNALESYTDAQNLANGFNNNIRSLSVGSRVYATEIQSDLFHATTSFGNRGGDWYRWAFDASGSVFSAAFLNCYAAIANANFFIEKATSIYERVANDEAFAENWTDEELDALRGHMSEAYFLKAYAESILVDRFCDAYDPATANNANTGIAIVNSYRPTSDKNQYAGRSTLEESYDQIYSDLEQAEAYIGVLRSPAAGSNYITVDAVKALRARVALARQDYSQAIADATSVINSGTYHLVAGADALTNLFVNDNQPSEVILQSYVALSTEEPGSNDYNYVGFNYSQQLYSPDYVPEQWFVDLYDDADYRKAVFFMNTPITISGSASPDMYIFSKFIGNPALRSGTTYNYLNAPKPFRLAELYLIAAEAYVSSGVSGGAQLASNLLNELRSYRIQGWETVSYVASQLTSEIRDERIRELAGEGFRMSDLRRYGEGITRGDAQEDLVISLPGNTTTELLSCSAGDFRFVWPIPQAEMDSNPQMVQNPGYSN